MKSLFVAVAMMLTVGISSACDVCACYFGVTPQYDQNLAGLRLRYRQYYGNVNYSMGNTTVNTSSYDLWTRFYPSKKVQVMVIAPYMYSTSNSKLGKTVSQGIGDMTVLGQYQLFSNVDSVKKVSHLFFVGGGAKVPTGKYRTVVNESPSGSGSFDFILSYNYVARLGQFGLNTNGSWKVNNKNPNNYKYGNDLNSTFHFFYWLQRKNFNFLPHAGVYFEEVRKDKKHDLFANNTGSSVWFYSFGTELYYKRLTLSITFQSPFHEYYVGKQLENYFRLISGVSINF